MFVFSVCFLLVAQVYCHRQQNDDVFVNLDPPGQTLQVSLSVLKSPEVKRLEQNYAAAIRDYVDHLVDAIAVALKADAQEDYDAITDIVHGNFSDIYSHFRHTVEEVLRSMQFDITLIGAKNIHYLGPGVAIIYPPDIIDLSSKYNTDLDEAVQSAKKIYGAYVALHSTLIKGNSKINPGLATEQQIYRSIHEALDEGRLQPGGTKIIPSLRHHDPHPSLKERSGIFWRG
ncbi:uncharacterized protein [Periplaneta americana]|uniref:uncharacterized protein n=1 Tax=Periplaneta americana TaxID=6978 RepID=UPI0037E8E065